MDASIDNSTNKKRNADNFSNLPDHLLHHILSYLDTKQVISTSLLSPKWRHVWTSYPFLKFTHPVSPQFGEINPQDFSANFNDFVTRVLLLRESSPIQESHFYSDSESCSTFHIDSWIRVAVQRKIQILSLQLCPEDSTLVLPSSLFNCKTLTSLRLDMGFDENPDHIVVPLPDFVKLPVLRHLFLESIGMLSTKFLDKFLLGCPVLETLEIINCMRRSNCLRICAAKLKKLEIYLLESGSSCRIAVSAPNLVCFKCRDYTNHEYSFVNISSLETAELDMHLEEAGYNPEEDAKCMMKCLKGFYNVKKLTVNPSFLEAISMAPDTLKRSLTPFNNLIHLELLLSIVRSQLQAFVLLLENSHGIETLLIELISVKEYANISEYWKEGVSLARLKRIEVGDIKGNVEEFEFLKIFLQNATTLMKMSISTSECFPTNYATFVNELVGCRRGSADATIEIRKSSSY